MKRFVIFLALVAVLRLGAEERVLTGADIVELVQRNNAAVKISASAEEPARGLYEQVLGMGRPRVSFSTDTNTSPLYGYSDRAFTVSGFTQLQESHIYCPRPWT